MPVMRRLVSLGVCLLVCVASRPAAGQENSACLECHSKAGLKIERDGREILLYVDQDKFGQSVHASVRCVNCHQELSGVERYPHEAALERVDCGECHDEDEGPIADYWESTHGLLAEEGEEDAPLCQDCHGNHYVVPLSAPDSAISPFNIPRMCAHCHAEGAEVARTHDIPQDQILKRYTQSIHGTGLFKQGLIVTAVCTSCHTGHNVLPHDDPNSTIHKDNIVATCMRCHGLIEEVHRKVIAGELWERQKGGEEVIPICVECHSPHEIREVIYDVNLRNMDCLRCHSDPALVSTKDGRPLYVDNKEHEASIHGRAVVSCAQCHTGVTPSEERACKTITEPVNCALCHESEVADYNRGRHGELHAKGDANAPYCTDCHGRHDIMENAAAEDASPLLRARVRESPTYSRNVPTLCARCHREGAVAAVRYLGSETEIIKHYRMSIHGKGLLESGLTVTATCTDCHTPHKELPHTDPESSVSPAHIAETCGNCHDGIYEQYRQSVHSDSEQGNPGYQQMRGMPPLPHCNDCHTSHTVERTDLADFELGIMQQCGKCHQKVTASYFQTYHGKATELGDTTRAKCYDCHGAHNILPAVEPESTLSRKNIVQTCGNCHPGSHRQFAGYLTHATHRDPDKYPALYYTFWGMTALLVGTFGFFGLHTLAWLPRSWKLRREHRAILALESPTAMQFLRFPPFVRKLHVMVIISFFGLAITGMMLKFAYTPWAGYLSTVLGGTETAGWIHRICAIITFGYMAFHLGDVFRRYRRSNVPFFKFIYGPDTILPRLSDLREFSATIWWFFGKGPRPQYGKWTYWEKFDYFAVFWGVAIIGATGLCLWFPEFFTLFVPGWSINVATIIHSDEALLATGFIFTIHFFNTHFRPEKFPMDTAIFTGRMSLEELKRERSRYYQELVDSGELEQRLVPPPPAIELRLVKFFGFTALMIGLSLILFIIYAMLVAYR